MQLYRGSSKSESLIFAHHPGFSVACECDGEETGDDDGDLRPGSRFWSFEVWRSNHEPYNSISLTLKPEPQTHKAPFHEGSAISAANTYNLQAWFQSKLQHVYLNITKKDRCVE